MRLITYEKDGGQFLGAWIDDDVRIVDLASASAASGPEGTLAFSSMQALIEAGPDALDRARSLVATVDDRWCIPTNAVRVLAPLPRPIQMRDFLAFPSHVQGCLLTSADLAIAASPDPDKTRRDLEAAGKLAVPADFYKMPSYYICNGLAVNGPDDIVTWPTFSAFIDYELEWAAVIGTGGSQISRDDARSHIFGYTIFNDWSARDEQIKAMASSISTGPGAGKDFANSLGPCIVTADEIPDPYDLAMDAYVNGERLGGGRSDGMHYQFEDMIAFVTRGNAIYPGEVFGSGTVGTGCSLENRRLVMPGDVIELKVEQIGTLRNTVSAPHLDGKVPAGFNQALGEAMQRAMKM